MPARCRAASGPPASPQDSWSACESAALPCRRRFSRKSSPSICKCLPAGRHRRKYRHGFVLRAGRSRTLTRISHQPSSRRGAGTRACRVETRLDTPCGCDRVSNQERPHECLRHGIVLRAGRSRTLRLREKHNQPPVNTDKTKSAYRRSSAFIRVYRRPLLQREFEVEDLFAAGGFVEAVQVNGGVALQGGLEIEKAAGRLSGREHPRGQCAAFDLPFVQRVLLALEHFDPTGGAVDCAGALRRLQVTDILGGRGFDAFVVGAGVFGLEAVQTDGLVAIVLDHDQHGEDAVLVGLEFPKGELHFVEGDVGVHTDGNLCVALVVGVTGGGGGLERRLLVRGKARGYTQEKSQAFENKRHLFPLPGPSGGRAARPFIVFRLARLREPRLLAQFARAVRISSPLV